MRVFAFIALLAALTGVVSCQTAEPPADVHAAKPVAALKSTTVVPKTFERQLSDDGLVTIPGEMLSTSEITRPRADVRGGPGAQFELEEFAFEHGTPVILFEKVGVWQKVLAIGSWKRGWVHAATLAPPARRTTALTLPSKDLPTVLATHLIENAKRYPDGSPLKVRIPTGSLFRSLMLDGATALVVLPETKSVMWVSRKDVQ